MKYSVMKRSRKKRAVTLVIATTMQMGKATMIAMGNIRVAMMAVGTVLTMAMEMLMIVKCCCLRSQKKRRKRGTSKRVKILWRTRKTNNTISINISQSQKNAPNKISTSTISSQQHSKQTLKNPQHSHNLKNHQQINPLIKYGYLSKSWRITL